jgi:histidinol-phosphate/aromatic aminotransferase/cobyric acid decarboxylase-like protein
MEAAAYLLDNYEDVVLPRIQQVIEGRDWLRDTLNRRLGVIAHGEHANHVLVEFMSYDVAQRMGQALARRGVQVKAGYPAPLDRHMLITAGPIDMMRDLFDRFALCMEEVNAKRVAAV